LEEALTDEDFLHFFRQLHRRYPQEKAERMLSTLDIEMARERETYYSDEEYAASLLGTDVVTLDEMFGTRIKSRAPSIPVLSSHLHPVVRIKSIPAFDRNKPAMPTVRPPDGRPKSWNEPGR
jgi:hypothetical protein